MKTIRINEKHDNKGLPVSPSLVYRMRKGLLKGKEVAKYQYNVNNTDSEVDDTADRFSYGINHSASTIRHSSNRKNRKTVRTITSNTTPYEGAVNGTAPSFEMPKNVGIPSGNHMTTNGIPSVNRLSGNSPQVSQNRKTFIRQRQAEMFIQQGRSRSLPGHYSGKTKRIKTAGSVKETVRRTARTAVDGAKTIYTLLMGGSVIPLVVVILICSIGLAVGSAFGIFFSGQNTGSGKTMQSLVQELNEEYQEKLSEIKASFDYDYLDLSGQSAVWREILHQHVFLLESQILYHSHTFEHLHLWG